MINVFEPQAGIEELKNIERVLESKWQRAGEFTDKFLRRFSDFQGVHVDTLIPVSSCTDALFLAAESLDDLETLGDQVIMPTIHFVGAANAIKYHGCHPIFCDVDERTLNPKVEHIERCLTKRTNAVLILHYGGLPCEDINEIVELCKAKKIRLIEDSACSLASKRHNTACGTFGDIGMWSFDSMKLISCGDGGVMYVRDRELREYIKSLTYYGMTSRSGYTSYSKSRWWEYDVETLGRYSALTDIDSAMLLAQMEKLSDFMLRRQFVDRYYRDALVNVGDIILPPEINAGDIHSLYFFWIQTKRRDDLTVYLRENDIYTTFRYYPLHRMQIYNQYGKHLPGANKASETTLLLPIHAGIKNRDLEHICSKIMEFYK